MFILMAPLCRTSSALSQALAVTGPTRRASAPKAGADRGHRCSHRYCGLHVGRTGRPTGRQLPGVIGESEDGLLANMTVPMFLCGRVIPHWAAGPPNVNTGSMRG